MKFQNKTTEYEDSLFKLLIPTEDTSLTLKDEYTGEYYHNKAGAFNEAFINYFVPSGALSRFKQSSSIYLLDVCFGLGYNSFVFLEKILEANLPGRIEIIAVDIDPTLTTYTKKILSFPAFSCLSKVFDCEKFQTEHKISISLAETQINLVFVCQSILNFIPSLDINFDLIFHDPFSPNKVPQLWTVDLFKKYWSLLLHKEGILLTYSAASAIRGGLKEAGFELLRSAACGKKTGGTIAFIASEEQKLDLAETIEKKKLVGFPLNSEEITNIAGTSGVPYRDSFFSGDRSKILQARQIEIEKIKTAKIYD